MKKLYVPPAGLRKALVQKVTAFTEWEFEDDADAVLFLLIAEWVGRNTHLLTGQEAKVDAIRLTHPAFPGWVLGRFNELERRPRTSAPIWLDGVVVGWRHDSQTCFPYEPERVASVSATPGAQQRVQAFYDAVMARQMADRDAEDARRLSDRERQNAAAQAAADSVMFATAASGSGR
jgi:hypothetical protein